MKKLLILFVTFLYINVTQAQLAKTSTEQYKASFEKAIDISSFLDYEGPQIPIQILKCGINDEINKL